jgi:hypothetical protein
MEIKNWKLETGNQKLEIRTLLLLLPLPLLLRTAPQSCLYFDAWARP